MGRSKSKRITKRKLYSDHLIDSSDLNNNSTEESPTDSRTDQASGPKRKRKSKKSKKIKHYGLFKIYIYRVLKQVHADCGISQKAMSVMDSFMNDIFERIASEASGLCAKVGKKTLQASDMKAATRLVLSGELSKCAVNEGLKALTQYNKDGN